MFCPFLLFQLKINVEVSQMLFEIKNISNLRQRIVFVRFCDRKYYQTDSSLESEDLNTKKMRKWEGSILGYFKYNKPSSCKIWSIKQYDRQKSIQIQFIQRFGESKIVAPDFSKAFKRVWRTTLLLYFFSYFFGWLNWLTSEPWDWLTDSLECH